MKLPSKVRVALVNRGGKGFHGGSKKAQRRRARKSAKLQLQQRKGEEL